MYMYTIFTVYSTAAVSNGDALTHKLENFGV